MTSGRQKTPAHHSISFFFFNFLFSFCAREGRRCWTFWVVSKPSTQAVRGTQRERERKETHYVMIRNPPHIHSIRPVSFFYPHPTDGCSFLSFSSLDFERLVEDDYFVTLLLLLLLEPIFLGHKKNK
jgi:hypothetical protein